MEQKRLKRKGNPYFIKEHCKTGVCPYSDDCFKCPASDCMASQALAHRVNKLPYDIKRANAVKGRKRRTKER